MADAACPRNSASIGKLVGRTDRLVRTPGTGLIASSPPLRRRRCSSAVGCRPSPPRVPLAALCWASGGRSPESLRTGFLSQGRSFSSSSSHCPGFDSRLDYRLPAAALGSRPSQPRLDVAKLSVSGSRPATAPRLGKSGREEQQRAGQQPIEKHRLRPVLLGRAAFDYEAKDKKEEAKEAAVFPAPFTVSLAASGSGENHGTIAFRSEAQEKILRELLRSTHGRGDCIRSTMEFWDGAIASSAEGVLSIVETGSSSYKISHNFLELSQVDAGATLCFEASPEMRIVVEGPSSSALIRLLPR